MSTGPTHRTTPITRHLIDMDSIKSKNVKSIPSASSAISRRARKLSSNKRVTEHCRASHRISGLKKVKHGQLPGTIGVMDPERGIALLEKWRLEGDAKADREAYEALLEEIELARK